MNKKTLLLAASSLLLLSSCSDPSPDSSGSGSSSEASPIEGAQQPSVKNPVGTQTELGKLRSSQGRKGLPQKGQANLLIVPVGFQDDEEYSMEMAPEVRSILKEAYFSDEDTGSLPSVASYINSSSYGALSLSGVVAPTITLEENFLEHLYDSLDYGNGYVVSAITDYVYDLLFTKTKTYDLADFDADKDGKVDGIVLAYSWAPAEAFYGSSLYSYLSSFLINETYFEKDLSLSSPISSITWTSSKIYDLTLIDTDTHIYVREASKMLGLQSYADLTGDGNGYFRAPLAHRDMMDGSIGDHNPFSKYMLGWIEPTKISASSLTEDKAIELKPFASSGEALLLSPSETGQYGEYLLVEYYTPTGLNEVDASSYYPYNMYGNRTYSQSGIRVYKVDSRLVEGSSKSSVSLTTEDPDYSKTYKLKNGQTVNAYYDFAYTNNSVNSYSDSGLFETFPLVEELSSKGFNRHMTDSTFALSNDDLFKAGDSFGGEGSIPGFYSNFALDGNGSGNKKLGIEFHVDSLAKDKATLTLRRAK